MSERTIETLAAEVRGMFERRERNNGTPYWCRKDDAPEWVADMCHDAHDGMFPDDYKYQYIVEALDMIADGDDDEGNIDSDSYASELADWLGSSAYRVDYADDILNEYGDGANGPNMLGILGLAQIAERVEVLGFVRTALQEQLDA